MSGQEVAVSLAAPTTLAFGGLERTDDRVGIFDTSGFPADFAGIGGFLSLAFFDETPFTVDYPNGVVELETPETLAERARNGRVGRRTRRARRAVGHVPPAADASRTAGRSTSRSTWGAGR